MKTKIIYISGSEIFNISDIKAAFDELKATLNIDKDTVLFGVPIDSEDIELGQNNDISESEPVLSVAEKLKTFEETEEFMDGDSLIDENTTITETNDDTEKGIVVPISSILSADTETPIIEKSTQINEDIPDIISDLSDDTIEETDNITEEQPTNDTTKEEDKSDLEKLFEEIQPLDDNKEEIKETKTKEKTPKDDAITNDATLKKLAKEYIHNQNTIKAEKKNSSGKFSKLKSILPFSPQKPKQNDDLFVWGGIAANDEDFSVPGFFTNTNNKK